MAAYEGMAYRYYFTCAWSFAINSGGTLTLNVKKPSGALVVWTPTVTSATAAYYDAAADELVAGQYTVQPVWTPSGGDPQLADPSTFNVKQRTK